MDYRAIRRDLSRLLSALENGLDLKVDLYLRADERIHWHIDIHAEVAPLNLSGRGETGSGTAIRVLGEAPQFERQLDRPSDAVKREVAFHHVAVIVRADTLRAENAVGYFWTSR